MFGPCDSSLCLPLSCKNEGVSDIGDKKGKEGKARSNLPVLVELSFSPGLDVCHPFHDLQCRLQKIAVVADRDISSLLELERGVLWNHN